MEKYSIKKRQDDRTHIKAYEYLLKKIIEGDVEGHVA